MKKVKKAPRIVRYELCRDRRGLLVHFSDGSFYHAHSNELSQVEKWIKKLLKERAN